MRSKYRLHPQVRDNFGDVFTWDSSGRYALCATVQDSAGSSTIASKRPTAMHLFCDVREIEIGAERAGKLN
jgi:hypothetical protein